MSAKYAKSGSRRSTGSGSKPSVESMEQAAGAVSADPEALAMFREAMKPEAGRNQYSSDDNVIAATTPKGNSLSCTLEQHRCVAARLKRLSTLPPDRRTAPRPYDPIPGNGVCRWGLTNLAQSGKV